MSQHKNKKEETRNHKFAERFRTLINLAGVTNAKIASALGISPSYVSKLTKGRAYPSEQLINSICLHFKVDKKWLLGLEGHDDEVEALGLNEIKLGYKLTELRDKLEERFHQELESQYLEPIKMIFRSKNPKAINLLNATIVACIEIIKEDNNDN